MTRDEPLVSCYTQFLTSFLTGGTYDEAACFEWIPKGLAGIGNAAPSFIIKSKEGYHASLEETTGKDMMTF